MIYEGVALPCGHSLPVRRDLFIECLDGAVQSCDVCALPFDWWECVRASFVGVGTVFSVQTSLGGRHSIGTISLQRGEPFALDLRVLGVPDDATVRSVNLTPTLGGTPGVEAPPEDPMSILVPAVGMGNELRQTSMAHSYFIYPVPLGASPPSGQELSVFVQFLDKQDSETWRLLADAALAHGDGDYRKSLVEAHTATDLALEVACARHLVSLDSDEVSRMHFMAKFGVVAASLTRHGHFVPQRITDAVRTLNRDRNRVAHPRRKKNPLDEAASASGMTASIFTAHMVDQLLSL